MISMSLMEWSGREKWSETAVGWLNWCGFLAFSMERRCSLNLSLSWRLLSPIYCTGSCKWDWKMNRKCGVGCVVFVGWVEGVRRGSRGGSRERVQGVRTPLEMTCDFLMQLVFCKKKKIMWFIGVEVEQETSAPPPKKNPGSAPGFLL